MKRSVVTVFLFLYFYNIVGYLALFAFLQYRVRTEVKELLKGSAPESELTTLAFHSASLRQNRYPLQWLEDHEFRYDGKLYDVLRSFSRGDTTYFVCLNDTQEERLFERLDEHVQRQMSHSGLADRFDAFKDVFKNSLATSVIAFSILGVWGIAPMLLMKVHAQFDPDIPFPPPRSYSTIKM